MKIRLVCMLLAGCTQQPQKLTWSDDRAIAGIFAHLDQDDDGIIQPAEYERTAYSAPDFHSLDLDKSGGLSPMEVLESLKAQDPAYFDQRPGRPPVSVAQWRKAQPRSAEARTRWETMRFLAIEVESRRPGAHVPSPAKIEALSTAGGDAYKHALDQLRRSLSQPPSLDTLRQ